MLARDRLSLKQMPMIRVTVFFGYGGESICLPTATSRADHARQIDKFGVYALFNDPVSLESSVLMWLK